MESNDEDHHPNCPEVIYDATLVVCNTQQCTSITQSSDEDVNLMCSTSGTGYTQIDCQKTPTETYARAFSVDEAKLTRDCQKTPTETYARAFSVDEAKLTREVEQSFIGNNTVSSSSASRVYINIDVPKVKDLSQSYKITLEVEDYSAVSTITLFNREAEKLFKVSADEVAKNLVKIKGREVFPSLFKGIVGKKIKVQIKVTKYNYIEGNEGFTVMKLIEDLHDTNKESYNDNAPQDVFAPQESPVNSLTEEGPPTTPTTPLIAITNSDLRNNTNIMIPKIEKVINNNSVEINKIEVEEKTGSIEQFKVPMQEGYNKSWLHFINPLLPEDSLRYFFNR
ncbi:uncharacterized protein A4U43_C08F6270 [Asparagus officinalis]|nr:uncharacterized protein A4U43_C08F6270 [Asparagus officinalis]